MAKNCYDILGINKNASEEEINNAYLGLINQLSEDFNNGRIDIDEADQRKNELRDAKSEALAGLTGAHVVKTEPSGKKSKSGFWKATSAALAVALCISLASQFGWASKISKGAADLFEPKTQTEQSLETETTSEAATEAATEAAETEEAEMSPEEYGQLIRENAEALEGELAAAGYLTSDGHQYSADELEYIIAVLNGEYSPEDEAAANYALNDVLQFLITDSELQRQRVQVNGYVPEDIENGDDELVDAYNSHVEHATKLQQSTPKFSLVDRLLLRTDYEEGVVAYLHLLESNYQRCLYASGDNANVETDTIFLETMASGIALENEGKYTFTWEGKEYTVTLNQLVSSEKKSQVVGFLYFYYMSAISTFDSVMDNAVMNDEEVYEWSITDEFNGTRYDFRYHLDPDKQAIEYVDEAGQPHYGPAWVEDLNLPNSLVHPDEEYSRAWYSIEEFQESINSICEADEVRVIAYDDDYVADNRTWDADKTAKEVLPDSEDTKLIMNHDDDRESMEIWERNLLRNLDYNIGKTDTAYLAYNHGKAYKYDK